MKKESLSALLFAAFVLPLSACGGNPTSNSSESAGTSEPPASSSASSSTASGPSIVFHYYRADAAYDNWALWLWAAPSGAGAEYKHTGVDDYGALFSYSLSTWTADVSAFSLGFIVKSAGSWTAKDPDGDRKLDFSTLTPDSSSNYNVWLKSGESDIYYTEPPKATISKAEFTDFTHVAVATVPDASSYTLYEGETVLKTDTFAAATASWSIELSEAASFEKNYSITVVFANGDSLSKTVDVSSLYDTSAFVNAYTYGEGDLGANYSAASTTFKVWSPVSSAITLRLYNSGTPNSLSPTKGDDTHIDAPMVRGEKGVWSLKIDGDLAGKYYTYIVSNAHYQEAEVVDPYAKGCGINGLRGMQTLYKTYGGSQLVFSSDTGLIDAGFKDKSVGACILWNHVADLQTAIGADNLGVVKLPTMKIGGADKQLGAFVGYKFMAIKKNPSDATLAKAFAAFASRKTYQKARALDKTMGYGPSNLELSSDAEIQALPFLSALSAQVKTGVVVAQGPSTVDNFWTPMASFNTIIKENAAAGTWGDYADAKAALTAMVEQMKA